MHTQLIRWTVSRSDAARRLDHTRSLKEATKRGSNPPLKPRSQPSPEPLNNFAYISRTSNPTSVSWGLQRQSDGIECLWVTRQRAVVGFNITQSVIWSYALGLSCALRGVQQRELPSTSSGSPSAACQPAAYSVSNTGPSPSPHTVITAILHRRPPPKWWYIHVIRSTSE